MPIKDTVISLLKEKQNQLMEQYARLEEMQATYKEHYHLIQSEMDRLDWICETIRRKIAELEAT